MYYALHEFNRQEDSWHYDIFNDIINFGEKSVSLINPLSGDDSGLVSDQKYHYHLLKSPHFIIPTVSWLHIVEISDENTA